MKTSYSLPILLVLAAALLAGCGGGGSSKGAAKLQAGDVAVVGDAHLTKKSFSTLLTSGEQSMKAQGQTVPTVGTADYQALIGQAMAALVQQAELNTAAAKMGIAITDKQIDARLKSIKAQYYSGSDKKFEAAVKAQKITDADVRDDVRNELIDQALFNKVTKNVKVSQAKVDAYFVANPTLYTAAATSRQVRHILVKSKTLANTIYTQVKAGGDKAWCTLAKKYSQDPSSKDKCGVLTVTKGETVPVFDKVAFSQPTKVVHAPVYDAKQYKAYFVIEPLTPIKPGAKTPDKADAAKIQSSLGSTAKNAFMTNWVTALQKSYCSGTQVRYQTGYAPSPDPCTTITSTSSSTTTTG
jgi:parvulin-like peptidyl-prolyl isomerase